MTIYSNSKIASEILNENNSDSNKEKEIEKSFQDAINETIKINKQKETIEKLLEDLKAMANTSFSLKELSKINNLIKEKLKSGNFKDSLAEIHDLMSALKNILDTKNNKVGSNNSANKEIEKEIDKLDPKDIKNMDYNTVKALEEIQEVIDKIDNLKEFEDKNLNSKEDNYKDLNISEAIKVFQNF
jgi:hypothetical protein